MTAPDDDSAEAIAQALARLRGRRGERGRGPGGSHGRRGGPWGDHGPHGDHGDHGRPGGLHGEHRHDGHPAHPGMPWPGDPSARFGGPARMRMLEALAAASGPLSVSDLGAAIGVDQPRASRLVQQGVERGYVRREADPDDARRTRIALTDEGRRVARGMRGERRQMLGAALAAFTDEERIELARLLTKLADNWEP